MKKFIVVIGLILMSAMATEAPAPTQTIYLPEVVIKVKTFDKEIFDTAIDMGADSALARMVVAQARYESGHYHSRLVTDHNNLFSMQHPRKRKTTSVGALATAEGRSNTYASYNTLRDSVTDLFFYFEANNISKTQPSLLVYVRVLKSKGFFEENEGVYYKRVKKILNQTKL